MDESKSLDKLESIINLLDNDKVTAEELVEVLDVLTTTFKEADEELRERTENLQKELDSVRVESQENLKEESSIVREQLALLRESLNKLRNNLQTLELKHGKDGRDGVDGKDGKDADEEKIVKIATEKLQKDLPKFGEPIRDALELLTKDDRLDKSAVKGLENYVDEKRLNLAVSQLQSQTSFLINKPTYSKSEVDALIEGVEGSDVDSFNGRTGTVVPQSGDYTTTLVTEGTNLYYTDTRTRASISATSPILYNSTTGVISTSLTQYTDEMVDDRVASLVVAGAGITKTYDDVANTLTIASSITQYTDALARSAVGWTKSGTYIFPTTLTDFVGIGLNNPSYPLHLQNAVSGGRVAYFKSTDATSGNTQFVLDSATNFNSGMVWQENATDKIGLFYNSNASSGGRVADTFEIYSFVGSVPIFQIHQSAGANSFYINSNSNVGLGTATIDEKLHVVGNGKFVGQYHSLAYTLTDGATIALNWNNGNVQTVTLGGNRTFTFANPKEGARYVLKLTQDATGSRTVTWPTITWQGGAAPTLTTTANKTDLITLVYIGGVYYGASSINY